VRRTSARGLRVQLRPYLWRPNKQPDSSDAWARPPCIRPTERPSTGYGCRPNSARRTTVADGTDYAEWITWTEIAPPERIGLLHGESRGDPNAFESVLTFERDGAATRIEMRTVFPTKELRDDAVEKYHAIEGGQQTLSNLAAYLTEIVVKGAER
jgi:uncharacterized protein YndB with AHSA1/START domain